MDGVIIDHTKNKIRAAKKFGVLVNKEQTPSMLIRKYFSPSDYEKFRNHLYDHVASIHKPDLMPEVKKTLSSIRKNKIPFYLISRQKYPQKAIGVLNYYDLWPKYFNEKNTYFVKEVEDKETKAKELGITHYIDDEQKVLDALASVKNKFLFDVLDVFKDSPYKRLSSWKEISNLI